MSRNTAYPLGRVIVTTHEAPRRITLAEYDALLLTLQREHWSPRETRARAILAALGLAAPNDPPLPLEDA